MLPTDPLPPADADVSITRFAASVIVLTSLWGCGWGGMKSIDKSQFAGKNETTISCYFNNLRTVLQNKS